MMSSEPSVASGGLLWLLSGHRFPEEDVGSGTYTGLCGLVLGSLFETLPLSRRNLDFTQPILGARSSSGGQPGSSQLERPPSSADPGVPGRRCRREERVTLEKRLGLRSEVFRCVVFWGPLLAELSASLPIAQSCARARTWDALAPTDHLGALAAPGVVLTPPPSILNPPPKILTRPGLF